MSEKKCGCYWCQKNISSEDATKYRAAFVVQVFQLMIAGLFTSMSKDVIEKATAEFQIAVNKFFAADEHYVSDLVEPIVNICFYSVGLDTELKPWDITHKANKLHDAIENAFKGLQIDNRIPETPILSKMLTPEMFVAYELGKAEFPKELIDIYQKNSSHRMEELAEQIQEKLSGVLGVTTAPVPSHTVH